jgi:hypothetical protein
MSEINHFKVFVLYSGNVTADVDNLHVKRIHLVNFSYIVIKNMIRQIGRPVLSGRIILGLSILCFVKKGVLDHLRVFGKQEIIRFSKRNSLTYNNRGNLAKTFSQQGCIHHHKYIWPTGRAEPARPEPGQNWAIGT